MQYNYSLLLRRINEDRIMEQRRYWDTK